MDDRNTAVSVVILTWNRKDDLAETLEKVYASGYPSLEVIVVDNASADGTDRMVAGRFPSVRYIRESENRGIAGYNTGFRAAKGDVVVVLDSDSYPHRDAIRKAVKLLDGRPDAGIVAFDVHTPTPSALAAEPKDAEPVEVVGYHGAGAAIRKAVFEKVGYWYEPFFLYCNEMDHALRTARAGFRILRSPSIRAFHKSSKVSRPSTFGPYYYVRNTLWLVWSNYPFRAMVSATAVVIYLALAESLYQRTTVYIKALFDALRGAPSAMRRRAPLSPQLFARVRVPVQLAFSRFG